MSTRSYSYKTKRALCGAAFGAPGTLRAELSGLIATCGSLTLSSAGLGVELLSENDLLKERVDAMLARLYGALTAAGEPFRQFAKTFYPFRVPVEIAPRLLADCGITEAGAVAEGIPPRVVDSSDDRRAYMRGAFLGGGSLNFGESGYLLEFHFLRERIAEDFTDLLNLAGLGARIIERGNRFVVCLRDCQDVCDALAHLGATKAVIDIQSYRAERQFKERLSRECNCYTSNLNRTVTASQTAIRDIALIRARIGLDALDPKLREVAAAREAYPEETLTELAVRLNLTKSCLCHRLRKLGETAAAIRAGSAGGV